MIFGIGWRFEVRECFVLLVFFFLVLEVGVVGLRLVVFWSLSW